MHHDVRMSFQQWLQAAAASPEWQGRGLQTVEGIARFVQEYHEKPNPGAARWGQGYHDVQDWGSTAYFDHDQVQRQIGQRLLAAVEAEKEAEALRLMDIWAKTAAQLQGLYANDPEKDLHQLTANVQVLDAWKALLQQGSQAFLDQLGTTSRDLQLLDSNPVGGIAIRVPSSTKEQAEEIQTQTVWSVAVGIDKYALSEVRSLKGCVSDMEAFVKVLEQRTKQAGQIFRSKKLSDKKATYKAILDAISGFEKARDGDICVFYFAGHSEPTQIEGQRGRGLIAYDSMGKKQRLDVSQWDIEGIIESVILEKAVQIICIYDTHEVSSSELKQGLFERRLRSAPNELKGSMVVLNACGIGQMAYELSGSKGNKPTGLFSFALLQLLSPGNPPITYRQLVANAAPIMAKAGTNPQTPFLEAFPPDAGYHFVFSDEKDDSNVIPLRFAEGDWTLVPPPQMAPNLHPSLDFFHTLVRRRDDASRNYIVVEKENKRLGLLDLAQSNPETTWDVNEEYDMEIVQVAPAKVKVAFDPKIWDGIRSQLEPLIVRGGVWHYCQLVAPKEAQYFIFNRGEQYQLRSQANAPYEDPFSNASMLTTGNSPDEFFHNVDRIALWEIVSKLGNAPQQQSVQLHWEKLEGVDYQGLGFLLSNNDKVGEPIPLENPQPIVLEYKPTTDGKWIEPAIRYTLNAQTTPLYAQTLVLDTEFGIKANVVQHLQPSAGLNISPNMVFQQNQTTGQYQTTEAQGIAQLEAFGISNGLHQNLGIRERRAFLKIFVSLQQPNFSKVLNTTNAIAADVPAPAFRQPISAENPQLDLFNVGCFTLPIIVRRNEQEVQEQAQNPYQQQQSANMPPDMEQMASGNEPSSGRETVAEATPAANTPNDDYPPVYEMEKVGKQDITAYTQPTAESTVTRTIKAQSTLYVTERRSDGWWKIRNLQEEIRGLRELMLENRLELVFSKIEDLELAARYTKDFEHINSQYLQIRIAKLQGKMDEQADNRLLLALFAFLKELGKVEEYVQIGREFNQ
jgi:hypothetical protein